MSTSTNFDVESDVLAVRYLDGSASPEEVERLDALLVAEPARREWFATLCIVVTGLGEAPTAPSLPQGDAESPEIHVPPPVNTPSLFGDAYHGTIGFFSQEIPLAWLITTVIMSMMLLGAWAIKVTPHQHIAEAPSQSVPSDARPEMVFVGRITGMVDVKWSDDPHFLPPPACSSVPFARKYSLSSGLLEITYDSGAKIILQGPCTYEVESTAGGYLALGKLTAKVVSGQWPVASAKPQAANQKSEIRNQKSPSSLIPHPSSLFAVRTPTAVITDLGTEFGVEVDKAGVTESRVFRGSVKVQVVGDGRKEDVVLRENESARVEGGDEPRITVLGASAKMADFTRRIPKRTIKTLDLVDVVAGGDGFSGRRDRGIDPTSGRIVDALSVSSLVGGPSTPMTGDGQYHRVAGMPFIDGVFIPDGGGDAVQVDSAGHVFDWFRDTANTTWQHIWAGGAFRRDQKYSSKVGDVDHALPGHGLVLLHANSAITFDLEAIRRANPGARLLRFRATVANTGAEAGFQYFADVWVMVDGRRRFQRRLINNDQGVASVLVPIYDGDRFLTLAATDAGDGISMDWIIFGDPRLELLVVDANEQKPKGEQTMNDP